LYQRRRSLAFSRDSEELPGDRVLKVSNWRENFTPTTHLAPRKFEADGPAKATTSKPQDSPKSKDSPKPEDSPKPGDSKKPVSKFQKFLGHFKSVYLLFFCQHTVFFTWAFSDANTLVTGITGFASSITTVYRNIMTSRDVQHDDEELEELSESDLDAGELEYIY